MRNRTTLTILASCCTALTACTAAPPKGPDTTVTTSAVGKPPAPTSAQAAVSSEAFTPYAGLGLSSDDGLAPGESTFAFAGACMTAEGYPGAAAAGAADNISLGAGYLSFSFPWGAWGYLGAADAQQYGFQPFGFIQNALGALGDAAGPPNPVSLSQPEQAAANKCITIVQDLASAVDDGPLAGIGALGNDISADVQHDAAVQAATRAWSACMAKNGYSFGVPQPVWRHELTAMYGGQHAITPSTSVSASAQQAQIAAAVTDSGCTQSSDLAGIYFAVQASYEKQLVAANQQALSAAVSQYRAAYAKELSKLPALLRTAKAQPFSPAKRPARRRSNAG
jgi:hypothetical protein